MKNADSQLENDFEIDLDALASIYDQAESLDEETLKELCPSFIELQSHPNRYHEHELIGKGALKEVFSCYDQRTKRRIAYTRPRGHLGPEYYEIFIYEAWLTSALQHPNIIKVHDAGVDTENRPFFTLDLKSNNTLRTLQKESSSREQLLSVFIKVCDAIAYAHSRSILHLDLKPDNIQCDRYGEVLVCDWGLGKFLKDLHLDQELEAANLEDYEHNTLYGYIKGSPGYMAPEQVDPSGSKSPATDIFALGCLLHFILTGYAPFSGTRAQILELTREPNLAPIEQSLSGQNVPRSLIAIILTALAPQPEDRYLSVIELKEEVERFLMGHATMAESPSLPRRALLFLARHRLTVLLISSALFLLSLSATFFTLNTERLRGAAQSEQKRAQLYQTRFEEKHAFDRAFDDALGNSKGEFAAQLVKSATPLVADSAYHGDLLDLTFAGQVLLERSLMLDPSNDMAHILSARANCISLNFQAILKSPIESDDPLYNTYLQYAKLAPQFKFTKTVRPTEQELISFFQKVRDARCAHDAIVPMILRLDYLHRLEKGLLTPTYNEVVFAACESFTRHRRKTEMRYDSEQQALYLHSDRPVHPVFTRSSSRLFTYFQLDQFIASGKGPFDYSVFHNLKSNHIDFSKIDNFSLAPHNVHVWPFNLRYIKSIRATEQQLPLLQENITFGKKCAFSVTPPPQPQK